jgi:hypothetical protein
MISAGRVVKFTKRSAALPVLGLAALWWPASVSVGATPDPNLPATVAKEMQALAEQCREVGGKPLTENAVKRVDLNGDGKDDFVLDVGSMGCDGAPSIYGDRGKGVYVYAGDGAGGAALAFSDVVYGAKVEGTGAAAKLWLTVSGPQCGKKPAREFASESFCERALTWNAKTGKFDLAPVSTVKMIE